MNGQHRILHLKRRQRAGIPLTHEEREAVYACMWRIWQYVGHEAEKACRCYGAQPLTKTTAAEAVLVFNRLEQDAIARHDLRLVAALAKLRTMTWRRQVRFLLNRYTLA